jgi:putative transposase
VELLEIILYNKTTMSRLISFIPNEYYHIYNRGVNKMNIFINSQDYERFQKLLYIINSKKTDKFSLLNKSLLSVWEEERGETLVNIGAYCLMPNHFHILIKSKNKKDTSIFLQRLQMSYSKYFNIKNDRSGVLFQGKSKAEHVEGDNYLKYLFSYIHLNPVKLIKKEWKTSGIKDTKTVQSYLLKYEYSSYLDYIGEKRIMSKILEKSVFPDYFPSAKLFMVEILEWLNYNKNEVLEIQQK